MGLFRMRDPYSILGVPKSATAAEVKKAFRRLAKQYHPDQSTEPKAKEKFAEASAAYEILGDEKKRGAFDRGEIDAEGKPKFHGFEGFSGGANGRRAEPARSISNLISAAVRAVAERKVSIPAIFLPISLAAVRARGRAVKLKPRPRAKTFRLLSPCRSPTACMVQRLG